MDKYENLSHTKWECKYHIVFIPKCRRRTLYEQLRQHLGVMFHELARQKQSRVEEGHPMPDSCTHDAGDTAEVRGIAGSGVHEREERDPSGAGVRGAQAPFRRSAFLGQRLFRFDGGSGRDDDSRVHPQPGEGGRETGADKTLAMSGHR